MEPETGIDLIAVALEAAVWNPLKHKPQPYPYPTVDRREDGCVLPGPFPVLATNVTQARQYAEDMGLLLARDLPFSINAEEE